MKPKPKRGPPFVIDRQGLLARLEAYIEQTEIPIVAEFAYKNGMYREQMYQLPELSSALKKLITKKEAALEKACLAGTVNTAMAIFSLKQIGWRDRQEVEHVVRMDKLEVQEVVFSEN